jgi:hypothetical protein
LAGVSAPLEEVVSIVAFRAIHGGLKFRGFDYRSNFSPFRMSVTGLWMLSNDLDPVSNSRLEGFCSGRIVRLNASEPLV